MASEAPSFDVSSMNVSNFRAVLARAVWTWSQVHECPRAAIPSSETSTRKANHLQSL